MSIRFDKYRLRNGDDIGDPRTLNDRFRDVDLRLHSQEEIEKTWLDALEELQRVGLQRIDEVLRPAYEEIATLGHLGAIFEARSGTDLIISGGLKILTIDEADRDRFAPAAYVALFQETDLGRAMLGRVIDYDRTGGMLSVDVDRFEGGGSAAGWVISAASATDNASAAREAIVHRDAAEVAAGEAIAARDVALTKADEADASRSNAFASAGLAASSVAAALAHSQNAADERALAEAAEAQAMIYRDEVEEDRGVVAQDRSDVMAARDATLDHLNAAAASANQAAIAQTASETARDTAEAHRDTAAGHAAASQSAQTIAEAARDASEAARVASQSARDATLGATSTLNLIYLGAFASDPVTDLVGDPLGAAQTGAEYWNTTDGVKKIWDGSAWTVAYVPVGSEVLTVFGRSGTVTAQTGDYSADKITTVAIPGLIGADVQTVLSSVKSGLDGKAPFSHSHNWSEISGQPSNLAGYGISDAYTKGQADAAVANKLDVSSYTASDVLGKLKSVDGVGSGLDADTLRGVSMTSTGQALLVAGSAASARTAIGLGSAATVNTGTSGAVVPLLNGSNIHSSGFTHTGGNPVFSKASGSNTVLVASADSDAALHIRGTSGRTKRINLQTGIFDRWGISVDATTEAGSNAGSNFAVNRYDDAGAFIDAPLTIGRSSGQVAVAHDLLVSGAISGGLANGTTATTQAIGNNSTLVATTAFVQNTVGTLIDAAPGALNTLNELAAALGDDPNFAATISGQIAGKLDTAAVSPFALTLLDDNNAAAMRTTMGAAATSHTHTIANVTGLQASLDGKATVADPSFTGTNLKFEGKDAIRGDDAWLRLNPTGQFTSGIYSGTGVFRSDGEIQIGNVGATFRASDSTFTYQGNAIWHAGNDGAGSGLDADKVDGLEASAFVRSNAATTVSAHTTWQDAQEVRVGTGADGRFRHDGTHTYLDNYTGNLSFRQLLAGGEMVFQGRDAGNTVRTLMQLVDGVDVRLYHTGAEKLRTTSEGVTVYGDLNSTSDRRLKRDVETLKDAFSKIASLRGVSFTREGGGTSIGVIAQEVAEVVPEVVREGEDGYLTVAYGNLVGLLIEAVKDLGNEIAVLKSEIKGVNA